ncbi:sporulation related protein [Tahibacter aquaticus]|jgi:cell division protein FtsN|uniref:Sporulation related protein n=1 Tax=Tahibacter aquaticus TaxID=520092 RepID=A0A4V3DL81_9GAMM|nr:SPOR domain-containing protein [Tahibacter aquaticus]TDR38248.1 sporulation related protein [Tahibacter aquaticus]
MAGKRKQATRNSSTSAATWPAWVWLALGVLLGLGIATLMLLQGWAPMLRKPNSPQPNPQATAPKASEAAVADDKKAAAAPKKNYDFYSVLPEMEVVIPDAELSAKARAEQQRQQAAAQNPAAAGSPPPPEPSVAASGARYVLQAGSYPDPKAAEELKAKLALSGFVAKVQSVNVNGKTWHRVRVGPYSSASDVETAKAGLSEAGINAIALKDVGE